MIQFLIKKFSIVSLLVSLFLLFYTIYQSKIKMNVVNSGATDDFYLIYYIFSISLVIISIISFYLDKKILTYLIIVTISTIFFLFCFEGYLTFDKINKIKNKNSLYKKSLENEFIKKNKISQQYDRRNKNEVFIDLKKINDKVKVSASPYFLMKDNSDFFHFTGHSFAETIYCNENGYWSTYNSDRYGFNNPDDEWDANEIEYLLIGDSFVKGACVNSSNNIASVLRILSDKPILNLGIDGAAPLMEYAALREYIVPKVKKVIWVYYEGNDLRGLKNELQLPILTKYIQDLNYTQNLKTRQKEINELTDELINQELLEISLSNEKQNNVEKISIKLDKKEEIKQFLKIKKTRMILEKLLPEKNRTNQPVNFQKFYPEFEKILKLTKDLVSRNNGKLYFVYLPEYSRYKNNVDDTRYLGIKKLVNELDIPLIDMHKEVFEKESNPLDLFPFGLSGHFNIKGYKRVAEEIYKLK